MDEEASAVLPPVLPVEGPSVPRSLEPEEKDVDIKPIISETSGSSTFATLAEMRCSDTVPTITESNLEVSAITGERNEMDTVQMIPESAGSDTAPMVSDGEVEIKEISVVTEPKVVDSRCFSPKETITKVKKVYVQPRYLGASAGSCHDYCKYGIKKQAETKPWKFLRKKCVKSQSESKDAGKVEIFLPKSKGNSNVSPKVETPDELSVVKDGVKEGNNKNMASQKQETRAAKALSRPKVSGTRLNGINPDGSKNVKDGLPQENQKKTRKPKSEDLNGEHMPEKTLYIVEPTGENVTPPSTLEKEQPKGAGFGNNKGSALPPNKKKIERKGLQDANVRKIPLATAPSSPVKPLRPIRKIPSRATPSSLAKPLRPIRKLPPRATSSSLAKPLRPIQKIPSRATPSPAKPLRPLRQRAGSAETPLPSSSMRHSSNASSIASHMPKENASGNRISNSKSENKVKFKRNAIKTGPTQKVNFRRGKIVEPQPEDSTPRRLKFKRRVVPDKQNVKGDASRRRFKESTVGVASSSGVKTERVVLKHRKAEGKKKPQLLFNNVIEETATKLAEARKSKVKALVGAFETVISLQDEKSTSPKLQRHTASTMNA